MASQWSRKVLQERVLRCLKAHLTAMLFLSVITYIVPYRKSFWMTIQDWILTNIIMLKTQNRRHNMKNKLLRQTKVVYVWFFMQMAFCVWKIFLLLFNYYACPTIDLSWSFALKRFFLHLLRQKHQKAYNTWVKPYTDIKFGPGWAIQY